MEWGAIVATFAGIVCGIGGFVISWLTFRSRQKAEDKEGGATYAFIQSDIGYIKAGIDDLKGEIKESRSTINVLSEKVTRVEESCKQAHKRIDNIEKWKE